MHVCVYIFIKRYELGLQFKENIMLQFIKENIMLAEQKQHPWSCPRGWQWRKNDEVSNLYREL